MWAATHISKQNHIVRRVDCQVRRVSALQFETAKQLGVTNVGKGPSPTVAAPLGLDPSLDGG